MSEPNTDNENEPTTAQVCYLFAEMRVLHIKIYINLSGFALTYEI